MILTLVFIPGWDQLYAIEPAIPLSHKDPFIHRKTKSNQIKSLKKQKHMQLNRQEKKKKKVTNGSELVFDDPFPGRLEGCLSLSHISRLFWKNKRNDSRLGGFCKKKNWKSKDKSKTKLCCVMLCVMCVFKSGGRETFPCTPIPPNVFPLITNWHVDK